MRILWAIMGFTSLGLGILGAILPLVPTVPFMLLATFCFARSSKRMHDWLFNHRTFGPMIQNWQSHGAISRPAKFGATASCLAVISMSLIFGVRNEILAAQSLALIGVLTFIWTRPSGPR